MVGKQIIHYRILEELGRGGMGVVYKAEDTKLNRTVALKFLPTDKLGAGEEKQRFEQEAKAAAQLNHNNIATIYEINEHEGETFIAMEYIEGETISAKVKTRPMKIKDAIKVAKQVAEGLHSAHEQGIVHRDIKSANIMLTKKGVVKIMDFGLAKMSKASMVTKAGTTLGTISYMSPEQSQGEKVDHRSDIWSLGVVLFEMISGQLPFKGEYESAIIYSIMNENPEPLTAVRTGVPMKLEEIVNKLLAKEPDERYQNIIELPVDLKNVSVQETATSRIESSRMSSTVTGKMEASPKRSIAMLIPWVIAGVLGIALVVSLILLLTRESEAPPQPLTASILFDEGAGPVVDRHLALSPDATQLAYVTSDVFDGGKLWIRNLKDGSSKALEGTRGAEWPFWSPDGTMLGYFASRELSVVPVRGGTPIDLAPAPLPVGGTWNAENIILYSPTNGPLFKISAAGGTPIQVTQPEGEGEQHVRPVFLPDGRHFLFQTAGVGGRRIYQGDLQTGQIEQIRKGRGPTYVESGFLVFHLGSSAFAQRFDPNKSMLSGQPLPLLSGLLTPFGRAAMTVTSQMIAFVPREQFQWRRPIIIGRKGTVLDSLVHNEGGWVRKFSHDGNRVAIAGSELWVHDLARRVSEPVPTEAGWPAQFAWSPDDSSIVYSSFRDVGQLRRVSVAGAAKEKVIFRSNEGRMLSLEWSPDGRIILFVYRPDETRKFWELWKCDVATGTATQVLKGSFNVYDVKFAPNGKWFAYTSDEGRNVRDVFLRRFPDTGGTPRRISSAGGAWPHWRDDGKELYYLNGNGHLVAVQVELDGGFSVSTENIISVDPITTNPFNSVQSFDVRRDGQSYLRWLQFTESDASRLTILHDWVGMLDERQ